MLIQRCMGLYGCMAPGGRRDEASNMMERHTAKYSEIQPNSIRGCHTALTVPHGACRACRGSGAWPGCAHAAVHAAMGAGYRPTPSVTPSSPTGTLSACVSVRHLVLYSRNTIQLTIQLYCSIQRTRLVTPPPRRHTAIQRHTALYEHTAIQHHTAYNPYNTPQSASCRLRKGCPGVMSSTRTTQIWRGASWGRAVRVGGAVCLSYPPVGVQIHSTVRELEYRLRAMPAGLGPSVRFHPTT